MFTGKWGTFPRMPGDLGEVDWNIVLRHINRVMDEAVAIVKEPDAQVERYEALSGLTSRLEKEDVPGNLFSDVMLKGDPPTGGDIEKAMKTKHDELVGKIEAFLKRRPGESVAAFSERMGAFFTHSSAVLATEMRRDAQDEAWHVVYKAAMALEVYQKEKGAYPETLAGLVPGYLREVPVDVFSGEALRYRRQGEGYVVYSVGKNGVDDGGERGLEKDDVAVRSEEK